MLCVCVKLVSPVSSPLHNLGVVFHFNNEIVMFILFHKKILIVLSVPNTCFPTFVTFVPKKKRACWTWLAKHATVRDTECICIRP